MKIAIITGGNKGLGLAQTRAILAKDPARRDKIEGRIPGGKSGTREDIADCVHSVASDQSRYVSGVVLPVDGECSGG